MTDNEIPEYLSNAVDQVEQYFDQAEKLLLKKEHPGNDTLLLAALTIAITIEVASCQLDQALSDVVVELDS